MALRNARCNDKENYNIIWGLHLLKTEYAVVRLVEAMSYKAGSSGFGSR